jgi:DNA-directed RNA polymerase beta subunit
MEGGLRFGDMEKDTLIAHGSSLLLKERFSSDREIVSIGNRSGSIAEYDGFTDKFVSVVDPKETISKVEMAYGFKLLLEQLKSLGLSPKLNLKDKFNQRKKE